MKTKTAKYTVQDYRAQLRAIQHLQSENKQMAGYSAALKARVKDMRKLLKEAHGTILELSDAWVDTKDADALRKRIRRELSQVGSESEEE